jgi:UV DNA damage endonuclease
MYILNFNAYICDMGEIGYCCINISLNEGKRKKDHITVNRGMTKKTFEAKGLSYVSELAVQNVNDLQKILEWNVRNKIFVYRMSSDMFPCIGFYRLEDLPLFSNISKKLKSIGDYAKKNSIRLSFHPTHFCIPASENPVVVANAIDELDKHAQIMDIMGLDQSHYYPINIHVNTTQPTREAAAERFCEQFWNLSESCRKRLVVENDDGPNQYSTKMLYDLIYKKIGIPITHDFHHHNYGPKDLTQEEALKLAYSTWNGVKPLTHMSSPKTLEDISGKQIAHADYIYEEIKTYGLDFDTELECKMKDLALLRYRARFNI